MIFHFCKLITSIHKATQEHWANSPHSKKYYNQCDTADRMYDLLKIREANAFL